MTKKKTKNKRRALPKYESQFIAWSWKKNTFIYMGASSKTLAVYAAHRKAIIDVQKRIAMTPHITNAKESTKFKSLLKKQTEAMSNFFFNVVAPTEIALASAVQEASVKIAEATGSSVDNFDIRKLRKAADYMVNLHFIDFLSSLLSIKPDVRTRVMDSLNEKSNMPDLLTLLSMRQAGKKPNRELPQV